MSARVPLVVGEREEAESGSRNAYVRRHVCSKDDHVSSERIEDARGVRRLLVSEDEEPTMFFFFWTEGSERCFNYLRRIRDK